MITTAANNSQINGQDVGCTEASPTRAKEK
jgi:hypothetical protein